MSRRRLLLLSFPLLLLTSGLLILPSVHWPLYAWWRGEAMYQGRPTSWWEREIDTNYRTWDFSCGITWQVREQQARSRLSLTAWSATPPPTNSRFLIVKTPPLATGDAEALPVLLQLVQSDTPKVRQLSVRGLQSLTESNRGLVPLLIRVARRDGNKAVRWDAAYAAFEADPEAAASAGLQHPRLPGPVDVADFVECALAGETMVLRRYHQTPELLTAELASAVAYIRSHPNRSSYLLLQQLWSRYPFDYARLPNEIKAAILCDALARHWHCNDWGWLDTDEPLREPARALIQIGPAALPYLRRLLDNRDYVQYLMRYYPDTKTANSYRRCDFAYRYACLILGLEPAYDPDPAVRDQAIEELQALLRAFDAIRPLDLPGAARFTAASQ